MNTNSNSTSSSREVALARRKAMSSKGKQAGAGSTQERTRNGTERRRPAVVAASSNAAATSAAISTPEPTRTSPAPIRASRGNRVVTPSSSSRDQARARRAAMSKSGRRAQSSSDRVRDGSRQAKTEAKPAERKEGCGCGCKGKKTESAPTTRLSATPDSRSHNRPRRNNNISVNKPAGRLLALARRTAMSSRGKAAADTPTSTAGLARQANPQLSSRELAQTIREHRSKNGRAGERKTRSAGRIRAERKNGGATDQPWKVGASETSRGQTVTGTKVSRSAKTTGDEQATCRSITGTEYLGAEIFREFCQAEPPKTGIDKVAVTSTTHGNTVTGNEVGRSSKVTGDEPGACTAITGTEYLAAGHYEAFCDTRPKPGPKKVGQDRTLADQPLSGTQVGRSSKVTGDEHGSAVLPTGTQYTDSASIQNGSLEKDSAAAVPPKVGTSVTLSGGTVTGTRVGRSGKVSGDEHGSCRNITGDEYVDLGQYQNFCGTSPKAEPPKVGISVTNKQQIVSGTQTGRSAKVTGDEPGTCKAVTGTPYAGLDQATEWCEPASQREIGARTRQLASTPGPRMTGIQPGVGGKATGDARGACKNVSGTPYVGSDQFADTCDGNGAAPGDSDFPQLLGASDNATSAPASVDEAAPGQGFTITSPARQAFQETESRGAVTGTRYETGNQITGPFDMATGKITGTEQFRFDVSRETRPDITVMVPDAPPSDEPDNTPERPRVTGEGQSAGSKITGDDWDRGDRVTGTEGVSAKRRNPTRPGRPMSAMPAPELKRNEAVPEPVSRVTGSSGNTEKGSLVTYSGGARG